MGFPSWVFWWELTISQKYYTVSSIDHWNVFENYTLKFTTCSTSQWVNIVRPGDFRHQVDMVELHKALWISGSEPVALIWHMLPASSLQSRLVNTLRPRQHGHHFPDNICKCIFFNEKYKFAINISLKFVPRGPVNNIPALVQVMAWRRPGTDAYMRHSASVS